MQRFKIIISYCTSYASCIGKTANHHKTYTCFWQLVGFLHFYFVFLLQRTIILSELKRNITSTGKNASLIHCAILYYLHPHFNCAKPTHSLMEEGQSKSKMASVPSTRCYVKVKVSFKMFPPRKLKTCSLGYKIKRVGLCSWQFKWTQLNWVKATTKKNAHPFELLYNWSVPLANTV